MKGLTVKIKLLRPEAKIPVYQQQGDAGFDFYCVEDTVVPANSIAILPTGVSMAIPEGYEVQVRLRSGVALKTPLILANAPGTIDSGFRGEVGILVRNCSSCDFLVRKGERIAQGVLCRYFSALFDEVANLPESSRDQGGFGSTGKH